MKVFKIKGRDNKLSAAWYYKVKNRNGLWERHKGFIDKRSSEAKAAQHQADIEQGIVGISDKFKPQNTLPITKHIEDYIGELNGIGLSKEHVYHAKMFLTIICKACKWRSLADISVDSFLKFRDVKLQKRAPRTKNLYQGTLQTFNRWCVKNGRMPTDLFVTTSKVKSNGDIRRQRRALTDMEVNRLLKVTESKPMRQTVYKIALTTGLRRGEISKLKWSDFHFNAPVPFLIARASTTKNRKESTIYLRSDVVDSIKRLGYRRETVFRMPTISRFYADCKAAKIPLVDSQGRRVDFHCLRHTLCTNLARGGIAVQTAMHIMRHSDIRLTTKTYTDSSLMPTISAIDCLPKFDLTVDSTASDSTSSDSESKGVNVA